MDKDYTNEMYPRIAPFITLIAQLVTAIPEEKYRDCTNPETRNEVVKSAVSELITKLVKSDLLAMDVDFIFSTLYAVLDGIKAGVNDTLDGNTTRISEVIYGLPKDGMKDMKVKQVNDAFQRLDKLKEVWKPILEDESLSKEIE